MEKNLIVIFLKFFFVLDVSLNFFKGFNNIITCYYYYFLNCYFLVEVGFVICGWKGSFGDFKGGLCGFSLGLFIVLYGFYLS